MIVAWENVVSSNGAATDLNRKSPDNLSLVYLCYYYYYYYYVFLMFKKIWSRHSIKSIVCITKSRTGECCLWERCVSSWSSYGLKRGIPWKFILVLSILWILCLPNISNTSYHGIESDQFYAQHKGVLVSISLNKIVLSHGEDTT